MGVMFGGKSYNYFFCDFSEIDLRGPTF